jgi:hypothetical protein
MFVLDFIFVALPGSLIVLVMAWFTVKKLKLMPAGMSFDWLVAPTLGLAAGGAMIGFTVEDLVIWPHQLQDELVGRQLVTPLSLRSHSVWGFQDMVATWVYEIDPATAERLARGCRRDPNPRVHSCGIAGTYEEGPRVGDSRGVSISIEGTTLTIQESVT